MEQCTTIAASVPDTTDCAKAWAANWQDRGGRPGESTWAGHLIGVAAWRYLIDWSVDQAGSEAHGVEVESAVVVMDLGAALFT